MKQITSRDGTQIAYECAGEGPTLILVVGAFNDRTKGAPLARALSHRFRVCTYDRRGRGDSTDAASGDTDVARDDVAREVEDLAALLGALGGSAALFGYSSGAALTLRAAAAGLPVSQIVLYDLPPGTGSLTHAAKLRELVAAGRRGEAVEYFQTRLIGMPEPVVQQLRHAPFRPGLEAIAGSLIYDASLMGYGDVSELARGVQQPTLAVAGAAGPAPMGAVAEALARRLPHGQSRLLEGQTHEIEPIELAPVIERFLAQKRAV